MLLQQHLPRFSERNSYADALLGMLRASAALERHVDALAPPEQAPPEAESAQDADEARRREEMTLALLGLVALGRTMRGHIERWAAEAPPPAAQAPGAGASQRGLLR